MTIFIITITCSLCWPVESNYFLWVSKFGKFFRTSELVIPFSIKISLEKTSH